MYSIYSQPPPRRCAKAADDFSERENDLYCITSFWIMIMIYDFDYFVYHSEELLTYSKA